MDNVRDHVFTDHPWLAADPVLGPWQEPADLDVVQTGAWILPDERPLPAELEAFLDAGTPPVYVGFGSMRAPKDVARVAIEAIRAQGRRALVARGWADLALIDDRDDCFAVGEVNQQALFRRVAAVVHHGGAGTTTTAARAGAPQVVVPQMADQPYWAGRVADLGIGAAHDGPTPTTESLSAALRTALTPETRARATAVAGTIRTDGATVAAKLLLDETVRLAETDRALVRSPRRSNPCLRSSREPATGVPSRRRWDHGRRDAAQAVQECPTSVWRGGQPGQGHGLDRPDSLHRMGRAGAGQPCRGRTVLGDFHGRRQDDRRGGVCTGRRSDGRRPACHVGRFGRTVEQRVQLRLAHSTARSTVRWGRCQCVSICQT